MKFLRLVISYPMEKLINIRYDDEDKMLCDVNVPKQSFFCVQISRINSSSGILKSINKRIWNCFTLSWIDTSHTYTLTEMVVETLFFNENVVDRCCGKYFGTHDRR